MSNTFGVLGVTDTNTTNLYKFILEHLKVYEKRINLSPIQILDKLNAQTITSKNSALYILSLCKETRVWQNFFSANPFEKELVAEINNFSQFIGRSDEQVKTVYEYKLLLMSNGGYIKKVGDNSYVPDDRTCSEFKYLCGLAKPSLFSHSHELQGDVFNQALNNIEMSTQEKICWTLLAKQAIDNGFNLLEVINTLYTKTITNIATYNLLKLLFFRKYTNKKWQETTLKNDFAPNLIVSKNLFGTWFEVNSKWLSYLKLVKFEPNENQFEITLEGVHSVLNLSSNNNLLNDFVADDSMIDIPCKYLESNVQIPASIPFLITFAQEIELFKKSVSNSVDKKYLCYCDNLAKELLTYIANVSGTKCAYSKGIDLNLDIPAFRTIKDDKEKGQLPEVVRFENFIKVFKPSFKNAINNENVNKEERYISAILAKELFYFLQSKLRQVFNVQDPTATVSFDLCKGNQGKLRVLAIWIDSIIPNGRTCAGLGGTRGRPPGIRNNYNKYSNYKMPLTDQPCPESFDHRDLTIYTAIN